MHKKVMLELSKSFKDRIPGGLADKKSPSNFDPKAVKEGVKVESEHPEYYEKLATIEKDGTKNVVSVVVLDREDRLLLGKRKDNGLWTLPGGHLEEGEDPHTAAIRELKEEAGLQANKLDPLDNRVLDGHDGQKVHVYAFKVRAIKDGVTGKLDPDDEISQWYWVNISQGLSPDIARNLHSQQNVGLSALGLQELDVDINDRINKAFDYEETQRKRKHRASIPPGGLTKASPDARKFIAHLSGAGHHAAASKSSDLLKKDRYSRAHSSMAQAHLEKAMCMAKANPLLWKQINRTPYLDKASVAAVSCALNESDISKSIAEWAWGEDKFTKSGRSWSPNYTPAIKKSTKIEEIVNAIEEILGIEIDTDDEKRCPGSSHWGDEYLSEES